MSWRKIHISHKCAINSRAYTRTHFAIYSPFNEFVIRYPNKISRSVVLSDRAQDFNRLFFYSPTQFLSAVSSVYALRLARAELKKKKKKVSIRVSFLALRAWDPRMGSAIVPTDKPVKKCWHLITTRAALSTALSEIKCDIRS